MAAASDFDPTRVPAHADVIERSTVRVLNDEPLPVNLTLLDIPFWKMAGFLFKLSVASIPAMIIWGIVWFIIGLVFGF